MGLAPDPSGDQLYVRFDPVTDSGMDGEALAQVILIGANGLMTGLTLSSTTVVVAVLVQPLLVSVKVTV